MSLQQILDQESLDYLPVIKAVMNSEKDMWLRNQMRCHTLRSINESKTTLTRMSKAEKKMFSNKLIVEFATLGRS